MNDELVVVCGAGGFIGGHLVADLLRQGVWRIRAIDAKPPGQWYQHFPDVENVQLDLNIRTACDKALDGAAYVYNLASNMGGMGFIQHNKARCMLNVLINTQLLQAAADCKVRRFFFASSACVYNEQKQRNPDAAPLKEQDAYPANPEDGYGWEKLFGERMCRHFREDFGLNTRVARYHNAYGPHCSFEDGREKAPAAVCRKVIDAKLTGRGEIDIWGTGRQTRSFMYIADCVRGTQQILHSDITEPINLGSSELVSIDQLVDIIEEIAGVKLKRVYNPTEPVGVSGRNSDNTLIQKLLGWQPRTKLRDGMETTYRWIYDQMAPRYASSKEVVAAPRSRNRKGAGKPLAHARGSLSQDATSG